MPSATLATMIVATFSEMSSQPIRPSTAHTGNALAMMPSTPKRADRKTRKITPNTVTNAVREAADLRRHDVVVERREDPARAGDRRRDAAAGEHAVGHALGLVDLLEHEIRAHRRQLHGDLRARVVAGHHPFAARAGPRPTGRTRTVPAQSPRRSPERRPPPRRRRSARGSRASRSRRPTRPCGRTAAAQRARSRSMRRSVSGVFIESGGPSSRMLKL